MRLSDVAASAQVRPVVGKQPHRLALQSAIGPRRTEHTRKRTFVSVTLMPLKRRQRDGQMLVLLGAIAANSPKDGRRALTAGTGPRGQHRAKRVCTPPAIVYTDTATQPPDAIWIGVSELRGPRMRLRLKQRKLSLANSEVNP